MKPSGCQPKKHTATKYVNNDRRSILKTIRTFRILALIAVLLQSCGAPVSIHPTVIPVPSQTPTPGPGNTPTLPPSETPLPTLTAVPTTAPPISRVLIISFDGLRPDAIAKANMVNVQSLMQGGAYTLNARTTMPSTTLPAHASMLTGMCPVKHIVRWNEYVPENGYARGTDIFDLAHAAGLRTAMVVGKEKLRQVTEPASTDYFAFLDETDRIDDISTIQSLAIYQIQDGFNLMLVHFPNGDLAGHEDGWMSVSQLLAYSRDDRKLGVLIKTLKEHGMYDDTIIIVTSDHGGHDTTHGSDSPEDMTIPWIISGPRVVPGQLTEAVHTMDTAATIAFVLGLSIPPEWDGVPVFEAFGLPVPPWRIVAC